jgi:hypothetical protein
LRSGVERIMNEDPGMISKLVWALLPALLFSSCAIRFKYPELEEPAASLERMVCCGSIEEKSGWAECGDEKSVFVKGSDPSVYSFVSFRELRGAHTLSWKWYDPSRRLYRATDPIDVGSENVAYETYIAWDKIAVSDDKENGPWTVAVFIDGGLLVAREFEIKPPGLF